MDRKNLSAGFYDTVPEGSETYEIDGIGEITFHREAFRESVADTVLSYLPDGGQARIPLFGYNVDGDTEPYNADETIMDLWLGAIDADLSSSGSNPLEVMMALFEEEGNVVFADLKEEITTYVPRVLEQHGILTETDASWDRITYEQVTPSSYDDESSWEPGLETGTPVRDLERTSEQLPRGTTVRGASVSEDVDDVPVTEPIDEEDMTRVVGERQSEAWDED